MGNSFIVEQVNDIQIEYCEVLKLAVEKMDTDDFILILDEINLFWFSKREVINLILKHISYDYDCFLFAGASILDIKEDEHYPFALLGDYRIIDDPLHKFISVPLDERDGEFRVKIVEEVKSSILDNINVLSTMGNAFVILPISRFIDMESDILREGASQAYWSLFKDNNLTLESFCSKINTIEEVRNALREDVIEWLIFSSKDERGLLFEENFRNYRNEIGAFDESMSDSKVFFYLINGFLFQAFNILLTCAEFKLTPYLRYDVIFNYVMRVGSIFHNDQEMMQMLNRAAIANVCYNSFNKSCMSDVDFSDYIKCVKNLDVSNKLSDIMKRKNTEEGGYSLNNISNDIQEILNEIYSSLNSNA